MKKVLRTTCVIIIVLSLLLSITACSKSGDGKKQTDNNVTQNQGTEKSVEPPKPVTIRFAWWGGETRHKATVDALEKFHDKYPHITVQPEYSGWSGYFEKLLTQFASKSAPDLIQISYANANEYVMRDQLYPLNDFINDGVLKVKDLPEVSLDMFKIDDKYYAVPSGIMANAYLVYNKDIFDKYEVPYPREGFTWDDYFETARKLTKDTNGDGKTDIWGTGNIFTDERVFFKMVYEQGGRLFSDDLKKVKFTGPEGVEVWTLAKNLLKEGIVVPPEIEASNPPGVDSFRSEQCALEVIYAPAMYADIKFNWGIAKLPKTADTDIHWTVPSMIYVMSNFSKAPKETAMLLDYILNDEEAGNILKMERGAPPNKNVRNNIASSLSETDKNVISIIDNVAQTSTFSIEPYPPGFIEVLNLLIRESQQVMYDKKTPEQAMKDLETEANKVIEKFFNEK
ncbi:MAG TPA: sugar ABC transporter substrate-binding protein [Clostridiales bacterium]|nr:sugar ABC transporter substrate-binding protein [Clostridiales bacterium]